MGGFNITCITKIMPTWGPNRSTQYIKIWPGSNKGGVVTATRTIVRVWKSISSPDVKKWMESMVEIVSYERMLARINDDLDNFDMSWGSFLTCST